jgi:hypothetical protein
VSTTATTHRPATSTDARLPIAALTGIALATVCTAIGTFKDPDSHAWRQMIVTFAIILVTAAVAFWFAHRAMARDTERSARASVVFGVLSVLSLVLFWAGTPQLLAAAAILLAVDVRGRRGGRWGRGPATAVALSAIAVVLAGVATFIG